MKPIPAKPRSIIAHVDGSGTGLATELFNAMLSSTKSLKPPEVFVSVSDRLAVVFEPEFHEKVYLFQLPTRPAPDPLVPLMVGTKKALLQHALLISAA